MSELTDLARAVGDLDEQTAVGLVQEKLAVGVSVLAFLEELQTSVQAS